MPRDATAVLELVRDLRAGNNAEEHFRKLFLRYWFTVRRYFERKGIPREDSQELAQEVFIAVYKGVRDLREEVSFLSWLFTIARHTFLVHLERQQTLKRNVKATVPLSCDQECSHTAKQYEDAPTVLAQILEEEKVKHLREALLLLPDQMRRCITMRVVDEFTDEEIATRLGISVNTVKAHMFKARKSLTAKLLPLFGSCDI